MVHSYNGWERGEDGVERFKLTDVYNDQGAFLCVDSDGLLYAAGHEIDGECLVVGLAKYTSQAEALARADAALAALGARPKAPSSEDDGA